MTPTNFAISEKLRTIRLSGALTSGQPFEVLNFLWLAPREGVRAETVGVQPMSIKEFISRELALEKEVEAVLTSRHGNVFYLWTVVDNPTGEVRERIFEREKAIIDGFPEYDFDFNIISRRGRSMDMLISDPAIAVSFRR
jgi:hypothetical protein